MSAGIEQMIAEGRTGRHLEMVRAHWASVRRLWLSNSDLDPGAKVRSELAPDFWIGCGMPGIATIKPNPGGLFEFAENGLAAVIVPAYDTIPGLLGADAERHVEELRDLVAVDIDRPDRFWHRRGKAVILGNAYLEIAGHECEPVPVFKNPLTWLRSGGAGVCILDWSWTRDLLLDLELVAEGVELGNRLEAALTPEIWVMEAA